MQPVYHSKPAKIESRLVVVDAYRSLTGNHSIPRNKSYWCLCNYQPNVVGAEIVDLVRCGLLSKSQFYGVDNDAEVIEYNKEQHEDANWLYGDWLTVCRNNYQAFSSASLIFYDGIRSVVNKQEAKYIARSMDIAPSGVVFVVNLMLANPYSGESYDPNQFHKLIQSSLINPNEWAYLPEYYSYTSSHAEMATYFFQKFLS